MTKTQTQSRRDRRARQRPPSRARPPERAMPMPIPTPPRLQLVPKRLHPLPALPTPPTIERQLSFDAWRDYGEQLKAHEGQLAEHVKTFQLVVGDWYAYGVDHWQRPAERAARDLGYSKETIENFAWVARKIPSSLRNDDYSFEDYRAVAALPTADERGEWLAKKRAGDWSGRRLRQEIARAKGKPVAPSTQTARRQAEQDAVTGLVTIWQAEAEALLAKGEPTAMAQADVLFDCAARLERAIATRSAQLPMNVNANADMNTEMED